MYLSNCSYNEITKSQTKVTKTNKTSRFAKLKEIKGIKPMLGKLKLAES